MIDSSIDEKVNIRDEFDAPSTHLFEDHIVYQMINIVDGLADKSEDHIEELIKMVNVVKENVVE